MFLYWILIQKSLKNIGLNRLVMIGFDNKIELKNFLSKIFFLILIILTLGLPIISWVSFIVFCFSIAILFSGRIKLNLIKIIISCIFALISLILQFSLAKNIQEGFAIYKTTENKFLDQQLPEKVSIYLKETIRENYSYNIPSREHFSRSYDDNWTFSADGFWQNGYSHSYI